MRLPPRPRYLAEIVVMFEIAVISVFAFPAREIDAEGSLWILPPFLKAVSKLASLPTYAFS
jgi:hypothetical protein